ncbi:GLPGLI family protein [Chryseobacterium sp. L7]|uniref:GLPGLI family protein n=1 Tax=Chryseobacterium endalhagicum TaxID=2797638 RepID=A0ABS1QIW8_9FLAO|nr:GLPGLI family protein [Chryseobacterium endalhagicum]MBL1222287.1 GLPGLI family protein [Chryseobacterium endalhagicum]
MNTTKIIILIFISINIFGQNKQFFYEYKSIPDSTVKNLEKEIMVLNIGHDKSEFYSFEKHKSDSTMNADLKKGIFSMPFNKKMNKDRVVRDINTQKIEFITSLEPYRYSVSQNIDLKWNILAEFNHILGYAVQKATTEFGGRRWIAWFAKEIPIQSGPYKFFGLPGLILKIEDVHKSHSFELKGIKATKGDFNYPYVNNFKDLKITYPKYVKIYKNFRKNPMAGSVGAFPDQTDANGVFHSGNEIFRQFENVALEDLKKDNNIIELDLLKN